MMAGPLLAGASLIAFWVGTLTGCSKSDTTGASALSFAQTRPGALKIAPVPFGEMKPEGITRGSIGGRNALVIVDDGGGFQVIWEDIRLP
jgi:hypothetical protein